MNIPRAIDYLIEAANADYARPRFQAIRDDLDALDLYDHGADLAAELHILAKNQFLGEDANLCHELASHIETLAAPF